MAAGLGAATALFAATIGLRQNDIKRVLAYSTVSQLGYMFLGGGRGAYSAGIFHLVTHAFFKALLFLGSGSVIHAMHHAYHATHRHEDAQDMRNMGGLRAGCRSPSALMWIATLAIAGIPPLRRILLEGRDPRGRVRARGGAAGVVRFYGAGVARGPPHRGVHGAAHGDDLPWARTGPARRSRRQLHEAPWIMTGPLVVLGVLSIVGGALNLPASRWRARGARRTGWSR